MPKPPKAKVVPQAIYPKLNFRCGPITYASIANAAKDENVKPGKFLRDRVEEWLQLNGYPVDSL